MRYLSLFFFYVAISLSSILAQNVFELRFKGKAAEDVIGHRTIEMVDVVLYGEGTKTYGDLSGRSALVVSADSDLSFASQESLWMEMWVNPIQLGATILISKGSGANYRVGLNKSGAPYFAYYSEGAWRSLTADATLEANQWQHLSIWFDSATSTATLFLNGRVVAISNEMKPFQSSDDKPLYIGGIPIADSENYIGLTGEIGSVIIARDNRRAIPNALEIGQSAFTVSPEF